MGALSQPGDPVKHVQLSSNLDVLDTASEFRRTSKRRSSKALLRTVQREPVRKRFGSQANVVVESIVYKSRAPQLWARAKAATFLILLLRGVRKKCMLGEK